MKHYCARLLSALLATAAIGGGSHAFAQETVRLQMSSGGITGTYYMIAAPLAKFLSEHSNLRITPNTSGGGYENIRRVDAGQAQFGMTQPDTMYEAWQGQKPFDRPLRNWRVVGVVTPPMANHVLVRKDDNIKTASDLKGKTFAIGAPGSGSTVSMLRFLEESGLKDEMNARMLPHQDYPDMLLDRKIDAFSRLGAVPAAVVDEIGAQKPVDLVDFGPELEKSKFLEKNPYYQKVQVKAGTYKGIDRDVTLFGNAGFIIAHKDVPEDVVYEFTKLAYSDEARKRVSLAFNGVNLDAKNPLEGNIGPLHPGAARFWKEQGINIPEPYLK
jgi:uncharacterized protein